MIIDFDLVDISAQAHEKGRMKGDNIAARLVDPSGLQWSDCSMTSRTTERADT